MSVCCLKSFIFNTQHICESTIFQKQKNMENNLTKKVLIFFNRQCNTTDCISDQLYSKRRKLLCKTATVLWVIKHHMTYKWLLKCNLGHANAHLSYKGKNRNAFSINTEVPPRVGGRSGLFLLALLAPGPLLAVSSAITAGPQKINRWLLAWGSTPGSSYWGLMH